MAVAAIADEMVRARQARRAADPKSAPAKAGGQTGAATFKAAVDQLTKYIPTSIVGSYLGLTALLGDQRTTLALVVFVIFWVLAPLSAFTAAVTTPGGDGVSLLKFKEGWPTFGAFIAFAIWAAALPGSTLTYHLGWLTSQVGAVAAVVGSLVLAAFGKVFGTNE
jgi:hypothetical protein